jgi:hypothetical protein
MDIQFEVQKIHSQFGTTEMANYQIQKLFDKLILEDRTEQLRKHAVVGRSEQLKAFLLWLEKECYNLDFEWDDTTIEDFLKSL